MDAAEAEALLGLLDETAYPGILAYAHDHGSWHDVAWCEECPTGPHLAEHSASEPSLTP